MLDNFGVGPANTIIQYFNGQDNQFFVPFAASLFPFLRPAYHKLVNMDSPVNGCFKLLDIAFCIFCLNDQHVFWRSSNSRLSSKEDMPFFLVLILKAIWKAIKTGNLSFSNKVPTVGLSS